MFVALKKDERGKATQPQFEVERGTRVARHEAHNRCCVVLPARFVIPCPNLRYQKQTGQPFLRGGRRENRCVGMGYSQKKDPS